MKRTQLALLGEIAPELIDQFPSEQRSAARSQLSVPIERIDRGSDDWRPASGPNLLGTLIASGFLVRRTTVLGKTGALVFGPGDVLPREAPDVASFPWRAETTWHALTQVEVARFDRVATPAFKSAALSAAVVGLHAPKPSDACALQSIRQIRGTHTRTLAFFWYLAERWGRRRAIGGVEIPIPLYRDELGQLLSMGRQAASGAVSELQRRDLLSANPRSWVLSGDPSDVEMLIAESLRDRSTAGFLCSGLLAPALSFLPGVLDLV